MPTPGFYYEFTANSHVTVPAICAPWCIQWIPLPRCKTAGVQCSLCRSSRCHWSGRVYLGSARRVTNAVFAAPFLPFPLVSLYSQATPCTLGQKRRTITIAPSRRMSTRSRGAANTMVIKRLSLVTTLPWVGPCTESCYIHPSSCFPFLVRVLVLLTISSNTGVFFSLREIFDAK